MQNQCLVIVEIGCTSDNLQTIYEFKTFFFIIEYSGILPV